MKKTTLKEIAQILDLSISSVSKALNDSSEISGATKNKVQNIAIEYGYVPNSLARNLKLGKTKTIGVIIPNVIGNFFALVLQGIEKEAARHKYKVIVCISEDKFEKEKESLHTLINGSVDGVLISLAKETQSKNKSEYLKEIAAHRLPIVQFDRVNTELNCDKVTIDDFDSAYKATEYLMQTGCKKIGFVTSISNTSVGELRKEGYLTAIKLNGNASNAFVLNLNTHDDIESQIKSATFEHKIDAFLSADELSAFCALNAVQSLGFHVPNDISVIGFTNGTLTKYANPSITTICQHATDIGRTAANILIKRIEEGNDGCPKHRIIKTELTIRHSTRSLI